MLSKKKYIFTNNFQSETKVLAFIKIIIGLICLVSLSLHLHLYSQVPTLKGGNFWPFIENDWKNQNIIARFLMWGSDRNLLMVTIPYINCMAMTGILLLTGAFTRSSELLQTWIIFSIIFCMIDLVLILPAATYAEYKALLLFTYIHSYIQKMYSLWIVKGLLSEIAEEKSNEQETDPDSGRRASRKY